MSKVQVLSPHLSNMIAAGEVVERPVNVIKECVENAMDAGATQIEIEVSQGGLGSMVIVDNGVGMDKEDAQLAFLRHATSKIQTEQDLFNIQTMGFRGEAMPSIASVSKVDLVTNNGEQCTHVRYEYGQCVLVEEYAASLGTRIEVSGLFQKTPARLKHMKAVAYEFSLIADLVNKLALSHPEISFRLTHDDRLTFQSSGQHDLQELVYQMFGREIAKSAIPFSASRQEYHISGLAIQPKFNRATKYSIYLTLNGRLIRSLPLQRAVIEAYSGFMPVNRYPIVILQIEVDSQLVDVNVHPNKWEVRLSKQGVLLDLIQTTLLQVLNQGIETVTPAPKREMSVQQPTLLERVQPAVFEQTSVVQEKEIEYERVQPTFDFSNYQPVTTQVVEPVVEEKPISTGKRLLDDLHVLAQLHDSYILCESPDGLVVIDQHAAQEKVHYEQLTKALYQSPVLQPLMVPLTFHSMVANRLDELNEKVAELGLFFEAFGAQQVVVRQVPTWLTEVDQQAVIQDLLSYFEQERDPDIHAVRHKVVATMACHSSIRFNRRLTMAEMEEVVRQLRACDQPYHCPHGRPTVIVYTEQNLRREFERG